MTHILTTSVEILTGDTGYDLPIEVHYTFQKGRPQTQIDPAEPPHCDIHDIVVVLDGKARFATGIDDLLMDDEDLLARCMEHYLETAEYAADCKAEAIREERALSRRDVA
jgi:hypothetical protein